MSNYSILKSHINSAIYQNDTQDISGTDMNSILKEIVESFGAGYLYMGVATPSTAPGTPDQNVFYIAGTEGTYTNFGGITVANEVAVLKYNGAWSKQNTGIKFVSVSQNTLSIGSEEVGELAGQLVENPEWVRVVTDSEDKILYGVKTDGKFYFGDGCPPQVVDYVNSKITGLELDKVPDIVSFLADLLDGVDNLDTLLDEKVDKETGKSLINSSFASAQDVIESDEYLSVITDSDDRIIEEIKGGGKETNIPCSFNSGVSIKGGFENDIEKSASLDNEEYLQVKTDAKGRILSYRNKNGKLIECVEPSKNESGLKYDEDGLRVLPDYYFDDNYLDGRILEINNEIRKCAINGDAFFWITDLHWDHQNQRLSPSIIKYIKNKTSITRLLCGGDISDGYNGNNMNYIWHNSECMLECFSQLRHAIGSNKVYATYGNHDFNPASSYDEIFYEYGTFREDVIYADEYKTSYYVDNAPQKMRYIALGEFGLYNNGYASLLTESVKTWFANVALDVESGWTIVIIIHALFTGIPGTENLMPYIDNNTGEWAESNGSIIQPISGCTDIIDIIDNYKANGGLGDIACVLNGHWHADRIHIGRVIAPATRGVPYILSQSDQFKDSFVDGLSDIKAPRTAGTITEQHFEVVVINKTDRTVKLFAIGSQSRDGIDGNVGNLVNVRVVTY